jgi:hypothetical protein
VRSIAQAVTDDLAESRRMYDWATQVVMAAGAAPQELVPFGQYVDAATALSLPSSLARALAQGQPCVERIDLLVQLAGRTLGHTLPEMDEIVRVVDEQLALNQVAAMR